MSNKKEIQTIVQVLNSTNDLGMKYPFGNKELTMKVRELETNGLIHYKAHESKWVYTAIRNVKFLEE